MSLEHIISKGLQPKLNLYYQFLKKGICQHVDVAEIMGGEDAKLNMTIKTEEEKVEEPFLESNHSFDSESEKNVSMNQQSEPEEEPEKWSNAYKASFLLNFLYNYIHVNLNQIEDREIIELAIEVFIDSIRPYVVFLDHWILNGAVEDSYGEFFIYQNQAAFEEDEEELRGPRYLWDKAFMFRTVDLSLVWDELYTSSVTEYIVPKFLH